MKNQRLSAVLLHALDNAHEGVTISDVTQPDNPLVYVNKGFLRMSGYTEEECLGRNCRYLQGADADPMVVQQIRDAIAGQLPLQVELLNYTKTGEPFWNYFSLTPLFDGDGKLTHYLGVQEDITAKKEAQKLAADLEQEKAIGKAALAVQDRERQDISHELHDNVNQVLATIRLYMDIAKNQPQEREKMIAHTLDLTDKVVAEVRRISHRLAGPSFNVTPFSEALFKLVESIRLAAPFTLELDQDPAVETELSESQQLVLYRIVQEGINNILKYAGATAVHIGLTKALQGITLSISDNGSGFDPRQKREGIGLRNIRNRIEAEGGYLQIITSPGNGTKLLTVLPRNS